MQLDPLDSGYIRNPVNQLGQSILPVFIDPVVSNILS